MKMECRMKMEKPTVLVVDDYTQLSRLMARVLSSSFDKVYTTDDPKEAEQILKTHKITHLLCDLYLGACSNLESVSGITFVEFWRKRYSRIQRAVIFTGADTTRLKIPAEVDAVVSKADGVQRVVEVLLNVKSKGKRR